MNMDREAKEYYEVIIQAKDMGGQLGGLSGTTTVNITLSDVNDNPPRFPQSEYLTGEESALGPEGCTCYRQERTWAPPCHTGGDMAHAENARRETKAEQWRLPHLPWPIPKRAGSTCFARALDGGARDAATSGLPLGGLGSTQSVLTRSDQAAAFAVLLGQWGMKPSQ